MSSSQGHPDPLSRSLDDVLTPVAAAWPPDCVEKAGFSQGTTEGVKGSCPRNSIQNAWICTVAQAIVSIF